MPRPLARPSPSRPSATGAPQGLAAEACSPYGQRQGTRGSPRGRGHGADPWFAVTSTRSRCPRGRGHESDGPTLRRHRPGRQSVGTLDRRHLPDLDLGTINKLSSGNHARQPGRPRCCARWAARSTPATTWRPAGTSATRTQAVDDALPLVLAPRPHHQRPYPDVERLPDAACRNEIDKRDHGRLLSETGGGVLMSRCPISLFSCRKSRSSAVLSTAAARDADAVCSTRPSQQGELLGMPARTWISRGQRRRALGTPASPEARGVLRAARCHRGEDPTSILQGSNGSASR